MATRTSRNSENTQRVRALLNDSIRLKQAVMDDEELLRAVVRAAKLIARTVQRGGTVYVCGNGGSACDAMHLCEELTTRYKRNRPGIRAVHFMDAAAISCWGNDVRFEDSFARFAETFCTSKDVLVAISTSGRSPNILAAARTARARKTPVIGLTGKDGGTLASISDVPVIVRGSETERIQECHITIIHIWCELLETGLLPAPWNASATTKAKGTRTTKTKR